MTQFNPPQPPQYSGQYGNTGGAQRGNGPAIASLVLGILGCVPFITGLLAVLFGIVGLRKTRDPYVGGKGLAIAGLILGILSLVGWTGMGGFMAYGYLQSKPAGAVAKQFVQDVSAGNMSAAAANSTISTAQLQADNQQLATYGAFQSVSFYSFNVTSFNGQTVMHLGGVATFANGPKACNVDLAKTGETYKVTAFKVQ
ncbi:MAG TPA: DUF4190 domain-containing protein [Tepidisphaeraceae bacterium]|jgi:hypothetical protein|nr:DUF4190 domain-containing protein [Tepidisphaeraceae bacterium]